MKFITALIFIVLSYSALSETNPMTCSQLKRQMETNCGSVLKRACNYFPDCFKRRDSCGDGGKPENAGECSELNDCHQALMEQYPSNFSENTTCEYKWVEPKKENEEGACRMAKGRGGKDAVCPGDIRPFRGLFSWLYPEISFTRSVSGNVDDFSCSSLVEYYKSELAFCTVPRKDYKEKCLISDEDREFYAAHEPPSCEYVDDFKNYKQGSMKLNVRVNAVNDSGRRPKDSEDSISPRERGRSGGAVSQ